MRGPGARLAERQNDGGRDFGVSWFASACSHSQPTSHFSRNIFRGCKHPDGRQTTSLRTHPSSGPIIWRRPDFPSIGSIGRSTARSPASRSSSCMAARVQAATARPPAVSIRSDTASCFSTSAVAARARPVRAMMTQHYDPAPYRQQRRFPFPMRGWKTVSSAAHRARA